MDDHERKELIDLYEKRLEKYGKDVRTVGWSSLIQQITRFEALSQIDNLQNKTLLDVGCGFGDLYSFLSQKKIQLKEYKGIDLSSKMIKIAKEIHSNKDNVGFEVLNLLDDNLDEIINKRYNYVFASGIFSFPIKDNLNYFKLMLRKMFDICSLGVAVNMPTTYVDYKDENLFYYEPESVFTFSKTLTRRVSLLHDYMPFEFTLFLFKNVEIEKNNVFIEYRKKKKINSYIE